MDEPVFDGDVLVLQGWIDREGIIPPLRQHGLRETVSRVLLKVSKQQKEIERLQILVESLKADAGN